MTKDYYAYIFDWDGNLAMTLEVWLKVHRVVLERVGIMGLSDADIVERTFGKIGDFAKDFGLAEDKLQEIYRMNASLATKKIPFSPLYPGAKDLLRQLKSRGKKLALLTTNYRQVVGAALEHTGLLGMFDLVVTGDDVMRQKPDPEGVLMCLEKFNVTKDETLMLGDGDSDLRAANDAGLDSVLFYPKSHEVFYDLQKLKEYKPTHIITAWSELR